jgi:hypothetical protein
MSRIYLYSFGQLYSKLELQQQQHQKKLEDLNASPQESDPVSEAIQEASLGDTEKGDNSR